MADNYNQDTFKWLNTTQFLGALNDNLFKLTMVFFLISSNSGINPDRVMANTGAVFVLPFLLFSDSAGVLADRLSKQKIIVFLKIIEIGLMILGTLCLLFKSNYGLYTVLFLMCTQSAFFGPAKYGIVPELVPLERLSKSNSYLVSATFLSIIIGTVMSSFMATGEKGYIFCGFLCILVSCTGLLASRKIYKTPACEGTSTLSPFFFIGIFKTVKSVSKDRSLIISVLTSSYFWMVAAYTQMNIVPYGIQLMNLAPGNSNIAGYLYLVVAVGISAGAILAGILSGRKVELGIVPMGVFGISICLICLSFTDDSLLWALAAILFLGISAGLFILPLNAFIQWKTPSDKRGSVLAATNFLNFVGILCATLMMKIFQEGFGFSPGHAFMFLGIMTFILGICAMIVLPDFLIRFIMLRVRSKIN